MIHESNISKYYHLLIKHHVDHQPASNNHNRPSTNSNQKCKSFNLQFDHHINRFQGFKNMRLCGDRNGSRILRNLINKNWKNRQLIKKIGHDIDNKTNGSHEEKGENIKNKHKSQGQYKNYKVCSLHMSIQNLNLEGSKRKINIEKKVKDNKGSENSREQDTIEENKKEEKIKLGENQHKSHGSLMLKIQSVKNRKNEGQTLSEVLLKRIKVPSKNPQQSQQLARETPKNINFIYVNHIQNPPILPTTTLSVNQVEQKIQKYQQSHNKSNKQQGIGNIEQLHNKGIKKVLKKYRIPPYKKITKIDEADKQNTISPWQTPDVSRCDNLEDEFIRNKCPFI